MRRQFKLQKEKRWEWPPLGIRGKRKEEGLMSNRERYLLECVATGRSGLRSPGVKMATRHLYNKQFCNVYLTHLKINWPIWCSNDSLSLWQSVRKILIWGIHSMFGLLIHTRILAKVPHPNKIKNICQQANVFSKPHRRYTLSIDTFWFWLVFECF